MNQRSFNISIGEPDEMIELLEASSSKEAHNS